MPRTVVAPPRPIQNGKQQRKRPLLTGPFTLTDAHELARTLTHISLLRNHICFKLADFFDRLLTSNFEISVVFFERRTKRREGGR